MTFSIETFAAKLQLAMQDAPNKLEVVREGLACAMQKHGAEAITQALEAAVPAGADIGELIVHQSPELTLLFARVPGRFQSAIHDHTVFACIGQLSGEERSVVYEASDNGQGLRVSESTSVSAGEVMTLPADAIHHIENPREETSCSLHIYGGDFRAVMSERSLWTHEAHERTAFWFPELMKQSVTAMKKNGNQQGLAAIVKAMPKTQALVDAS